MKIRLLLMLLLAQAAGFARADTNNLPVKIGAVDAARHYDRVLTVTGTVAQVSLRPSIVFINLDHPYPDSPFVAIIHSQDTNRFGNLKLLKGEPVEITGKVINYHNRPEIVLEKPSQLLIITNASSPSPAAGAVPAVPTAPRGTNDLSQRVM
jgi:hypothetical protein